MDTRTRMDTHTRGRAFESLAARHLGKSGFTVIGRNVRHGREEIDLIVRRRDLVAFVEVKGRSSARGPHPLFAIDARKRAAIARVARHWIRRHGRPGDRYRLDAVAILPGPTGWVIDHIADAWRPG